MIMGKATDGDLAIKRIDLELRQLSCHCSENYVLLNEGKSGQAELLHERHTKTEIHAERGGNFFVCFVRVVLGNYADKTRSS